VSAALAAQAKEMIRIDQRFGRFERKGRWTVSRRIEIATRFCRVTAQCGVRQSQGPPA
jgi:hypothetical protein